MRVLEVRVQGRSPRAITSELGCEPATAMRDNDADGLLTLIDFPAERWKQLRTSNVLESPFA